MNALETLLTIQDALDAAMMPTNSNLGASFHSKTFPAVNLFKQGHSYVLKAEIPGLSKESIEVEVKNDCIRISGSRRPDFSSPEVSLHRAERDFGKFDRTVKLPIQIDRDRILAEFEDGILTVKMDQSESDKPAKIAIN